MLNNKRAIIIELNTYHGEVLPSLAYFLNQLGYLVEVYASRAVTELNPFVTTASLNYSMHTLSDSIGVDEWQKKIDQYDLLVWNSVEPIRHLEVIEKIKAPTLAVVHNGNRILAKEYKDYFSVPYRQALVLSPNLQKYFQQEGFKVNWVFPSYYSDESVQPKVNPEKFSFCVQGKVEFKRRNYLSIIDAVKKLNRSVNIKLFDIRVIGKSDSFEGFLLRQLVNFSGAKQRFHFSSKLSLYREYFAELARSDFLCPLIDETKKEYRSYFVDKASSSIPTALGNGLVPIVQRKFAMLYEVEELSICYDDGYLLLALEEALKMSNEELLTKKRLVLSANEKLLGQSVQNLSNAIQKIGDIK